MAAYLIADLQVTNPVAYEEYRGRVPAMIAEHGGRYLVRGGQSEELEGAWQPRRMIVLEFPTMVRLQAFYASAEYAPLKALRIGASDSRIVAIEGL